MLLERSLFIFLEKNDIFAIYYINLTDRGSVLIVYEDRVKDVHPRFTFYEFLPIYTGRVFPSMETRHFLLS